MNQLLTTVGITLIHSLWQSALIWLGLRLSLRALRHHAAAVRHGAACMALLSCLLAPLVTLAWLRQPAPAGAAAGPVAPGWAPAPAAASAAAVPNVPRAGTAARLLSLLVLGWAVGCAFKLVALVRDYRAARSLAASPLVPLPAAPLARWRALVARLQIRRPVRVGLSPHVAVPSLVGWLKPVVLFPLGALSGLSDTQLESLFAHELAHLRRHDFLVNLGQALAEAVFFFNPATLAISDCIRTEREHACDDVAVALVGDPHGLARALAQLEENRQRGLALAAAGGQLLPRIQRLVAGARPAPGRRPAGWAAASVGLAYLALLAVMPLVATGGRAQTAPVAAVRLAAEGNAPDLKGAIDGAARAWLAAMDAGQFDLAYASAGIWLHAQSTDWGALGPHAVATWKTLGRCTGRAVAQAISFETNDHGAYRGEWAYATYRASYAHGGDKIERVQFQKEPDGVWRVAGFSIGDAKD